MRLCCHVTCYYRYFKCRCHGMVSRVAHVIGLGRTYISSRDRDSFENIINLNTITLRSFLLL